MTIRIRNQQKKVPLDLRRLREIARGVLRQEGKGHLELDILVVDDCQIALYHKKYLDEDGPTDVIAFGMQEGKKIAGRKDLLGDVILSAETARRVAKELGISVEEEIERYLIHGILHLLGYRDHHARAARRMYRRQEEILKCQSKRPKPLFSSEANSGRRV